MVKVIIQQEYALLAELEKLQSKIFKLPWYTGPNTSEHKEIYNEIKRIVGILRNAAEVTLHG